MWVVTGESEFTNEHSVFCVKETIPTFEWFEEYFKMHAICRGDISYSPHSVSKFGSSSEYVWYRRGWLRASAHLVEMEE